MVLNERASGAADLVDAGQSRLRNLERVKQGFEAPAWYLEKRSFNIRIRAETVKQFLGGMSPQSMLDIGCGDGSISVPVLTPRNRLTLVDMSATMLGIARSRVSADLSTRVTTINDQFMNARLAPASFDLILCLGVLAYVSDSRAFAERIASLLGPRGDVIVECSDSSNAVSKLRRALGTVTGVLAPGKVPLILHSSAEVTGIFGQLGFALKGSFRYSLPLPGIRKFMSQGVQYKTTRALYGSAAKNRLPWLGSECIYHFRRES